MKVTKGLNPVTKAVGVFSAVAIIVGGVTYAAFQGDATLSQNTISSASALLQVNNLENGGGFSDQDAGFEFSSLVPGGDYSAPQQFSLKNSGDLNLWVTVSATEGTDTEETLDPSKVWIKFTNQSLSTPGSTEVTLAQIQDHEASLPGVAVDSNDWLDTLGEINKFDVQVKIASDAVESGETGVVSGFDLVFKAYDVPAGTMGLPEDQE